ncbi:DUF1758 domain-containing protein [Trichonephila clavipes]|nr:DUF1758 domain-containing protein [Trichonephila clavipes]
MMLTWFYSQDCAKLPLSEWVNINIALISDTRAFGEEPRNFEPWSNAAHTYRGGIVVIDADCCAVWPGYEPRRRHGWMVANECWALYTFVEPKVLSKQKIELAKLQLAKLEKEVELQRVKNKALSLNPAAKVEDKQFETNKEKMITSIKTLSLPVPTRSENFNLFFQSLERAFLIKKINDEYKSEILINLLGERAHNVLLYIKEEELNDYEKLKSIVLREFQLTPRECLNSFKNAVKSSGETYIQFAARLTANFQYYCSLRKVNSFESLCDLIISDKLFETLNKETATHIGIREAEDWFRPIDLAKESDIYISSRN